ncbi:hypothetical protein FG386_001718 [Cryptosporidium ryanae]|uniref:uncharacterized protein n=1 Tax=Cryptosporidium ryanae TaxID=515981 RepID=UPI00351AAAA8|nr:hypothetical protein FG386_001718 [Cryptosporidium ryanae]
MKIEKVDDIQAPGDGILSVSFQPHPINDKWNLERVSICGEKGVSIWSFDYNGNHHKLGFIESITNSIIKLCRWSNDGKYLAIVDMEQISIYYKNDENNTHCSNNIFKSYTCNSENKDLEETNDDNSEQLLENWTIYSSFPSSDINECTDICWLKGSRILINGTVSGNLLVYNIEEKCQSCNLFVKDMIEIGFKDRNIKQNINEVGHVSGLNANKNGLFLACQMSNKKLYVFEVKYNYKEADKKSLSRRNCIQLSYLLDEDRLISNSPCIFTFIRRPIFDPITCLIGCPYGEVKTSYFSCLFPFKDVSDSSPFGWTESRKMKNNSYDNIEDVWNLNNVGNISSINGKLEFPEAYRLRGHQRRIRLFEFSPTIITGNDELFTLCAQSSQDGSVSFWKVIYDLNKIDKIKSIECFFVLSNFMDEQASVTDISFNNMNNAILIGSDDNKLTLISFEFDEFSLLKSSIINSSNIYESNWNIWNYDYIPERPSVDVLNSKSDESDNNIQKSTQKNKVPIITVSEIIEHQERTEESKITSKGTKIRRIQPINLSLISNKENTDSYVTLSSNTNIGNEASKYDENKVDIKTVGSNLKIEDKENKFKPSNDAISLNVSENTEINNNNDSLETRTSTRDENINKCSENSATNNDINTTSDKVGICKNPLKKSEENDNNNNCGSNSDFYLGLFMREWVKNIKYPKRLSVSFDTVIDDKTYKMCIFVDNRKVLENKNKSREVNTEIICIKQEKNDNNDTFDSIKKDVQWFKPISNNNIVTHIIRIKDMLLIFYSNYVDKDNSLFINTNIDILNMKTGTNIITGITMPYVLKLTLCCSLEMILLITINGKLKLLELPSTTTSDYNNVRLNLNWILDTDWSYLNDSKLSRVDLFIHKNRNINTLYNNDINKKPIVVLYYEDGKVFSYSFSLLNFIRIDDLEYYKSDYWSMVFQKTALEFTRNEDKRFSIIKDLSISVTDEYNEYESEICNITNDIYENDSVDLNANQCECDENTSDHGKFSHDSFLLREIQKTSRYVHLNNQIKKDPREKIFTLFGHIIGNLISTEHIYEDIDGNNCENTENVYSIYKKRSIMCTRMHIEHQMSSSLVVNSRNEFKYWFKVYIKHALDCFESNLLKEIVNHCIEMIRESVLTSNYNNSSRKNHSIPSWCDYHMLCTLELDPIHLLLNDIIPFIDEYIHILEAPEDISKLTKLYNNKANTMDKIKEFKSELVNIKTEISLRIKRISEEYEERKSLKLNSYKTQSNYSSQNSNVNIDNGFNSRLDFLNSIF